jgi:hypothetical protein
MVLDRIEYWEKNKILEVYFCAGMDMMQQYEGAPPYPAGPAVEKTWKPVVGGVLIVIGALVGIVSGAILMWGGAMFLSIPMVGDAMGGILATCGIILLIFGIIGLLGGIFAMMRRLWGLAILGGIFALISGYFILGLIGLILVAISKKEFS